MLSTASQRRFPATLAAVPPTSTLVAGPVIQSLGHGLAQAARHGAAVPIRPRPPHEIVRPRRASDFTPLRAFGGGSAGTGRCRAQAPPRAGNHCSAACRRAEAPAQLPSGVFQTLPPGGAPTGSSSRRLPRHTSAGVQHARQAQPSGACDGREAAAGRSALDRPVGSYRQRLSRGTRPCASVQRQHRAAAPAQRVALCVQVGGGEEHRCQA